MSTDLRPYGYPDKAPHFCADGHEPIRHWDSENEQCPLCRAKNAISDATSRADKAEEQMRAGWVEVCQTGIADFKRENDRLTKYAELFVAAFHRLDLAHDAAAIAYDEADGCRPEEADAKDAAFDAASREESEAWQALRALAAQNVIPADTNTSMAVAPPTPEGMEGNSSGSAAKPSRGPKVDGPGLFSGCERCGELRCGCGNEIGKELRCDSCGNVDSTPEGRAGGNCWRAFCKGRTHWEPIDSPAISRPQRCTSKPEPTIVFTSCGGKCPNQAEGTINGVPFYFRARHGEWQLHVGAETPEEVCGPMVAEGTDRVNGEEGGYWTAEETRDFATERLRKHVLECHRIGAHE